MFLEKFTSGLSKGLDWIARAIFMLIVLLVLGNVLLRLLGRPFDSCYELVGLMMAVAVSFSLAHCAFQEGHIALTIFVERFNPRTQLVLGIIANLIILVFLAMTVNMVIIYSNRMLVKGHIGMNTRIPLYYFAYSIALGFLGYCCVAFVNLIKLTGKMIKK